MSTRLKYILTFVGGVVTGIVLVFAFAFIANSSNHSDNIVMFDTPQATIDKDQFKIVNVFPNGGGLARSVSDEFRIDDNVWVLFRPKKGQAFYDDQKIEIPQDKCVKQIGICRYKTKMGDISTVPIVDIFDKD